ncbi:hypothetical protein [Blastococcus sp. SYSU DS0539]
MPTSAGGTRANAPDRPPGDLTGPQWSSLFRCWTSTASVPHRRAGAGSGGRPSPHGHAPAALAAPRWH